jgi:hypothetical protein
MARRSIPSGAARKSATASRSTATGAGRPAAAARTPWRAG